ncbi:MAG: hypothetical protein PUJ54_09635 [Lachnospiraceae bacterium]|nr:hypothetical protein [Lachnospiraceae bacterium]MDY4119990.1 hypothetical protein [Lachnospiraceae bacterium]
MKQKLIAMLGALLTTCMAFSWSFGSDWASILLLGEYEYPSEETN